MMAFVPAASFAAPPTENTATTIAGQQDAPMRMEVGSDNPLLLTQVNIGNDLGKTDGFVRNYNSGWSIAQLWASVPEDVRGNFGFVLHQGHTALSDRNPEMSAEWLEDNVAEADALGIPIFILWDEGKTLQTNKTRWEFLEHLYTTYPNFMGTVNSEQADTLGEVPELLRIANQYGGFHIHGGLEETNALATRLENPEYWNKVTPYSKNFIYNPKNFHENFESSNAWAQGAWLSGVFDNWGPYFDGYPYYECGFFGETPGNYSTCGDRWSRSMPETLSSTMMLDQWQNGATVFHLENQLDVPTTGNLYSPYFYQSILPALRHILTHPTPSKGDVVAQTSIAFSETEGQATALDDSTAPVRSTNPPRTTFYSMYEKTQALTAVQKNMWFYLRSSGRYNIIPRLPKLAPADLLTRFETVLTKSTYDPALQYGDARAALFDTAYPAISEGDAFVQRSGTEWLVYNTNDRDNFNEDAVLDLSGETFTRLELPEITPHTWAAITENGSSLEIKVNNYRTDRSEDLLKPAGTRDMEFNRNFVKYAYVPNPQDQELRTTTLNFDVAERPALTISGYDRNNYDYTETWDSNTGRYSLIVKHNGVVDIRLSTEEHEAGWNEVATTSQAVTKKGTTREYTFDGTSVAWRIPDGLKGPHRATVSVDGTVYAEDVDLSKPGIVFRATGLPNSVHTLKIEGSPRVPGSFLHVPSVEHFATNVETNDFNYGTADDDEDSLYGSDHWRVIDGRLKLVGYVFPFYGDTTVYNTNSTSSNVQYEATVTLVQGTSGALIIRGNEDRKTGYHFRLDPSRTAEGRTGTAAYSCSLMIDYGTRALATCPTSFTLEPDKAYRIVVTAQGNTVRASVDGVEVLSYTAAGADVREGGYTGLRAPQMQSDAGYRLGQFIELDDVKLTNLDSGELEYESSFSTWDDARGWMTETPLVFDWHEKEDPRSSYTFPWAWDVSGGTWGHTRTDVFTSGMSGTFTARADNIASGFTALGGKDANWAADGGYDNWAWLKLNEGDSAGLATRAQDNSNMYQARLNATSQTVSFGTVRKGKWTELASAPSPMPLLADAWTLLEVNARGPLFTVRLNGIETLSLRDDTYPTGAAGIWVGSGGNVSVDDAKIIERPALTAKTPRAAAQVVPEINAQERQIVGYDHLAVKTARTKQPSLPPTVTARFSDGTKEQVAVVWPDITAEQLQIATNPTESGPYQGKFIIDGSVDGTDLTIPVLVTVMPNIVTPVNVTHTYTLGEPTVPNQTPGISTFTDGQNFWTKALYVRWDQTPNTAEGAPTQQTLTGTIGSWPWEKVTASVTVEQPNDDPSAGTPNVAVNKPVTVFGSVVPATPARAGAKMVDDSPTTGWYTGGASDGAYSDGTATSTQGSLCSWAYVDLGADYKITSYAAQFGENLSTFGRMYDPPYQIQILSEAEAEAAGQTAVNSSVCTRRSGALFGADFFIPAQQDVWKTVGAGNGTTELLRKDLNTPVTARYVRVLTNEPATAHRYGTAIFELQVFGTPAR